MFKPGRTHILAVTLLAAIALAAPNSVSEELVSEQPPSETAPGTTDTTLAAPEEPQTTTTHPETASTTIETTTTALETTSTTQEPTTTTTAAETTTTAPEPTTTTQEPTTTTPPTPIETTMTIIASSTTTEPPSTTLTEPTTTAEYTTTTLESTSTTLSPEIEGVVADTQFMDLLAAAYVNGKIDEGVYTNASVLERGERLLVSVRLKKGPALTVELQALGAETTKNAKRKSLQAIRENVEKAQKRILPRLNGDEFIVRHKYALVNGFSGSVSKAGLKKLLGSEDVASIEAAKPVYAMLFKSNPLINGSNPWFATKGNTGEGQAICVIDSGIDYTHPNIGGCSEPFSAGSCDKVPYGYDYVNSDDDPMDDHWHGTHVSGIIVSNSTTYRGIAPDARIIAMKALDADGYGSSLDIDQAIDDCIMLMDTYNITVITLSIGYNQPRSDRDDCTSAYFATAEFIQTAYDAGIFIDAASGNSGYTTMIDYPACDPNVVSVGAVYDENLGRHPDTVNFSCGCFDATTAPDNVTCYSNRANILDVWAPGSYITSTYDGGFGSADGTSMAAPHVAGAAALIQEYGMFRKYGEWLTPEQIKTALVGSGVSVTRDSVTKPRIDAYNATRYYTNLAAPKLYNGSVTPMNGSKTTNFTFRVRYTDRDDTAPAYVRVVIDGATRNMTAGASTWDSYVEYNYSTNLTLGNHTYYFTASDSYTVNTTTNTSNSPEVVNKAPTLAGGAVTPSSGTTSTFFNFTVTYADQEGDSPVDYLVYIDGSPHQMTAEGANYVGGVPYYYSTQVAGGNHTYYFNFSDSVLRNVTVAAAGPYVNRAPTLSGQAVDPEFGSNSTLFNFTVTYRDLDGEPPSTYRISLDDVLHDCAQSSEDYLGGAAYYYNTTLDPGTHGYYFTFSDGNYTNTTTEAEGPTVYSLGANCEGSPLEDGWSILEYTNCTDTTPLVQDYLNVTSGNILNLTGTNLLLNTTRLTVDGTIILGESAIEFMEDA